MPVLFVANCTKQVQSFVYRLPEETRVRQQEIPVGRQVRIHQEADLSVLNSIIEQHIRYGLVPSDEIDRNKTFTGLCFRIGKPVDPEIMLAGLEKNDAIMRDASFEARKMAAAAVANSLGDVAEEHRATLGDVSVEVLEEGDNATMSEHITVGPRNVDPSSNRGKSRSRRRG